MQSPFYYRFFWIAVIAVAISASPVCAGSSSLSIRAEGLSEGTALFISQNRELDREVSQWRTRYLGVWRTDMEEQLGRAQMYFSVFEPYLQAAHLPNALKYLPVVESGLRPEVVSSSGAAGLWQIMAGTGRYYGLIISDVLDERKDPHRSTQAATQYLTALQAEFCDWLLVLAAYNCGPGRVRRAMRQAGSQEYTAIRAYLPRQTRRYIAKFLAVCQLGHTYAQYGLKPNLNKSYTYPTQILRVDGVLSLRDLSEKTGVPLALIRTLNPALTATKLPSNVNGWHIQLPQEGVRAYFKLLTGESRPPVVVQVMERKGMLPSS